MMRLNDKFSVNIETKRFMLRRLTEADASEKYLSWLNDDIAGRFIQSSTMTRNLEDIRNYIREKSNISNVIFLGIFDKSSLEHIGNIKYDDIDMVRNDAVMGILIGEARFRGLGVGPEVIIGSANWLRLNLGVNRIHLAVNECNTPALRAYLKTGFVVSSYRYQELKSNVGIRMHLDLV
jgi:ribosomal-protein-alanine N-acetyltransferase